MRVLSLGGGVQSSTLLLMALEGELQIDVAIFADPQWESAATYAYMDYLEEFANEGSPVIPIHRVTYGNLRADALAGKPEAWMPLFSRDPKSGKLQQLKRQCTRNYKITPIRRHVRALGGSPRHPVEQIIGISLDEWQRMRDSGVKYIRNVYPLVDMKMTRQDCLKWLRDHDYDEPPKSACLACPYHRDDQWADMRSNDPVGFADAVEFDEQIRMVRSQRGQPVFVHKTAVALPMVTLTAEERGQGSLFDACDEGVCFV